MSNKPGRNRRGRYIVDPEFQYKYVLGCVICVAFFAFVLSLGLYALLHQEARAQAFNSVQETAVASKVMIFSITLSCLAGIGVGLWAMLVTNRLLGPLTPLQSDVTALTEGRVPKPRTSRSKDECKALTSTFGAAMETLATQRRSLADRLEAALACLSEPTRSQTENVAVTTDSVRATMQWLKATPGKEGSDV
jgi:hypothetical protein